MNGASSGSASSGSWTSAGQWPEDGAGAREFGESFFQLPELPGDGSIPPDLFFEELTSGAGGMGGAAALQQVMYGGMPGRPEAAALGGSVQLRSGLPPAVAVPQPAPAKALPLLPHHIPKKEEQEAVFIPLGLRRPTPDTVAPSPRTIDGATSPAWPAVVAEQKPRSNSSDGPDEMHSDDAHRSGDEHGIEKRARKDYTADEKVRANRDRNREHARNTRLRKKAYVEKLKQTVQQLGAERERSERDRSVVESSLMEAQAHRRQVLQTLFFYRARGERSRELWSAILDESFTCVIPITPYRSFLPYEVVNNQRVVIGIDGFIQDVCSLKVLTESIGRERRPGKRVCVQYYAGPQDTIVVGEAVMCRWMMKTENAAQCGALCECFNHGMLKARFSPQHRLTHLEMVFDVMSFMQQLQRASGQDDFRVVPNTPHMAQSASLEARAVIEAVAPYRITYANEAFAALSGYAPIEVTGRTLDVLQGADTDRTLIARFVEEIEAQRAASMDVVHYAKDGRRFLNYIRAYPLATDGRITHYLAVMEDAGVPELVAAAAAAAGMTPGAAGAEEAAAVAVAAQGKLFTS